MYLKSNSVVNIPKKKIMICLGLKKMSFKKHFLRANLVPGIMDRNTGGGLEFRWINSTDLSYKKNQ